MPLPKIIERDDIQLGITLAGDSCHQPDSGLLGPGSICWQIMKENLTSLALGRVALLTLADSRLSQLTPTLSELSQRLQHTHVFMLKLVFGNIDQVLLTLDSMKGRAKTLFDTRNSSTLLYALTAWMESMLIIYQDVVEPISTAHQERLFEETMLLARALGVPASELPEHWHAHRRWWNHLLDTKKTIAPHRKHMGYTLIRELGYPGRLPYGRYLPLAPFQVPEHLRQAFRLPQTGLDNHRAYQKQLNRLMDITRKLPPKLRYQPAWHEAQQRLGGRARADLATRVLNRWWTGESELVSSGWSIPRAERVPGLSY